MIRWCVVYSWGCATTLTMWSHIIFITPNLATFMSLFFFIIHRHFIWIYFAERNEVMVVQRCQWPHSVYSCQAAQPVLFRVAVCPASCAGGVATGLGSDLWVYAAYPVGPPERWLGGSQSAREEAPSHRPRPLLMVPWMGQEVTHSWGPKSHFRLRVACEDSWESLGAHWTHRCPAALLGFCRDGDSLCNQTAACRSDRSVRMHF